VNSLKHWLIWGFACVSCAERTAQPKLPPLASLPEADKCKLVHTLLRSAWDTGTVECVRNLRVVSELELPDGGRRDFLDEPSACHDAEMTSVARSQVVGAEVVYWVWISDSPNEKNFSVNTLTPPSKALSDAVVGSGCGTFAGHLELTNNHWGLASDHGKRVDSLNHPASDVSALPNSVPSMAAKSTTASDGGRVTNVARVTVLDSDVKTQACNSALVARVVREGMGPIKQCYEGELRLHTSLQGRMTIRFVIDESGRGTEVELEENTLNSDAVVSCTRTAVHSWRFPFNGHGCPVLCPIVFSPM
jgi:hypothetical protein